MKKFKKILILIMMITLVVGCGNKYKDNSPEGVALNIAERLSDGNYENIEELIYAEEGAFIDEDSFKGYLNENSLNIEGNEKLEIVETESTENMESKSIEIKIDNNKILRVNTVKKDGKWYVDLGNEFDNNLVIKVPTGSVVKLNNKIVDFGKYGKTNDANRSLNNYEYKQKADEYTLPKVLRGDYKLSITNDQMLEVNETIKSYKYSYTNKNNNFYDNSKEYILLSRTNNTITQELKTYLEKYYNDVIKAGTDGKEFSTLEYFDKEGNNYSTLETNYNNYKDKFIDTSFTTWTSYFSDLKATFDYNHAYYGGFYVSKDRFLVTAKIKLTYTMTTKYKSGFYSNAEDKVEQKSKEYNVVLDVIKKDGKYYIENGSYIYPQISRY